MRKEKNMLTVKNHHFYMDGKEIFLFGGEIHYFRLPRSEWEDRILKAKAAGMNTVSTLVPWMYHEPRQGEVDIRGQREPETDLGAFLGLIQKHGMYCILKPGPYIMSEMRNHGLPDWLFDRYPQILGKTKWGEPVEDHYVHLENELFLQFVEQWYRSVGQVAAPYMQENGGPIIMVQLDNEIGMLNWCSGMADYCEGNIARFHEYVKQLYAGQESYGDLEDEAFYRFVQDPPADQVIRVNVDLTEYSRLYYKRYFQKLQGFSERYLGKAMNIVNIHGFDTYDVIKRGKDYPSGVSQLYGVAGAENTITGGDYYLGNLFYDNFQDIHLANAVTFAAQSPDQPLFSDEFQGGFQVDTPRVQPTSYDLATRMCIADGMDGICYFLFAGGVNPEGIGYYGRRHDWQAAVKADGSLNTQYPYFAHLGKVLGACGDTLAKTNFEPVVELGVIMDYYMTEYQFHDPVLAEKRQEIERYSTDFLYNGMGKGLAVTNLSYRGFNLEQELSPEKTPVLFLCANPFMSETIQQKLLDYVKQGGRLFIYPTIPVKNMFGQPCTILKDALGCETDICEDGLFRVDDVADVGAALYTDFGPVDGAFAWDQRTGAVGGFLRQLGDGMILCYGLGHCHDYYFRDQLLLDQLKKLGVEPAYTTDFLDDKLFISSRANRDGGRYLTVINMDEYGKTTHFFRKGEPLFGGKEMAIPARKGLLLPLDMELLPGLRIKWSTGEIIGLKETEETVQLTLALVQPIEELMVEFAGTVDQSRDYRAEWTDEGVKICSNLDGRIHDELVITFYKENAK